MGVYVDADREGQQWLLRYCTGHAIPTQHHLAYTYATTAGGRRSMRAELHAGEQAGLGAVGTGRPSWPFPTGGGPPRAGCGQWRRELSAGAVRPAPTGVPARDRLGDFLYMPQPRVPRIPRALRPCSLPAHNRRPCVRLRA